ncbi:hypothetical protein BDD12DRAFT_890047 [Trichophaea hybrida]|nr:hypothetical protein BDD12DRAFT_890047 [Trichophaea hybrida]
MGYIIDNLRQEIQKKRHQSIDGRYFISQYDTRALFTRATIEEAIRECVEEYAVPDHQETLVVNRIYNDGIIVFGILIWKKWHHKLMRFIEHNALDSQLPLDIAQAEKIAENVGWDFASNAQWEFLPRTLEKEMSGHHCNFRDEEILPFIAETRLGEGSFGEVFQIAVLPSSQTIFPEHQTAEVLIVRKAMRKHRYLDSYKECLQILSHLRHPNITRYLASYTQVGTHHILFPLFPMDLERFLQLNERFGDFKKDITFYTALLGLSSAIDAIHTLNLNVRDHNVELRRVGYHHDIKPSHILVNSRTFYLSGFTFAKFYSLDMEPQDVWKSGLGEYVAPECMDEIFRPREVGRPLDIWSFGCMISEVAAYIEGGPQSVEFFRNKRLGYAFRQNIYDRYFFSGDALRPQVISWFKNFKARTHNHALYGLLDTASCMLRIDPTERPNAAEVNQRLSFLSVKVLFDVVQQSLARTLGDIAVNNDIRLPATTIHSDNVCFTLWGNHLQLSERYPSADVISTVSNQGDFYRHILTTLHETLDLEAEVNERKSSSSATLHIRKPVLEKRHQLIQDLWNSLPANFRYVDSLRSDNSSSAYCESEIREEASSQTSIQSITGIAWLHIRLLFVDQKDLLASFERAAQARAAEKITRKLASLLNRYCSTLQKSASSPDERHAIKIIKHRRIELATDIAHAAVKPADSTAGFQMFMLQNQVEQKSQLLERYLRDQHVHGSTSTIIPDQVGEEQAREEQTAEVQSGAAGDGHSSDGSDTDSVRSEVIDGLALPNLDHLKAFLTCGNAFASLKEEFEAFAERRVSGRDNTCHEPPPQLVDFTAGVTTHTAGDARFPDEQQPELQQQDFTVGDASHMAGNAKDSIEAQPSQEQRLSVYLTPGDTPHMIRDAKLPNQPQLEAHPVDYAAGDTANSAEEGDSLNEAQPELPQPVDAAGTDITHTVEDADSLNEAQPELPQPVDAASTNTTHMVEDSGFSIRVKPEQLQPAGRVAGDAIPTEEEAICSNLQPSKDPEREPLLGDEGIEFQYGGVSSLEPIEDQHKLRFDSSQPRLSVSDRIKVVIEKYAGMPVLWWPLRQPNRAIPADFTRMSWDLDCGHIVSIDVPTPQVRTLQTQGLVTTATAMVQGFTQTSTGVTTSQNCNSSLNSSQTFTLAQQQGVISNNPQLLSNRQYTTAGNTASASNAQSGQNLVNVSEKYVHWCVDSSSRDTKLHHVCVESPILPAVRGNGFIAELNSSYKRLRGWRWTFSFQVCIKAKIVKFIRPICNYDDLVGCLDDEVTISDISSDQNYHIEALEPKSFHFKRVEVTLAHQLHCGSHCNRATIEELISHLPKKATGKLERHTTYGYGLYAQQGLALYKIFMAHGVTQAPLWGFAVYWVIRHHGDLQNAFQPALYMLALLTAVIGVADYYDK